ncbi:MAG: hypothetical protein EOM32_13265 [Spirochaetia bacterium]|nr:hypothetical protein [Spirochaetia bacterium]
MGVADQSLNMRNKGMKRIFLALFLGVLVVVLAGCDEKITYTYADLLGEWDFPEATHISVMQSDDNPSEKTLDIRWREGTIEYFAMADGTASGATFTGTYSYNATDVTDPENNVFLYYYGDDDSEPLKSISITLTLEDDKLKAVCTGDSPLGGDTFTLGTLGQN